MVTRLLERDLDEVDSVARRILRTRHEEVATWGDGWPLRLLAVASGIVRRRRVMETRRAA